MESITITPKDIHLTLEQKKKFWKFINGDDMDFYEEYVMHLPLEDQKIFFKKNPGFMSEFPVDINQIELLEDHIFRGILRKIKAYDEQNKTGSTAF